MTFDKDKFLFLYQQDQFGTLNDNQKGGILNLLGFIEDDNRLTDVRHIAYILATIKHETADTYQPIEEYGKGIEHPYGLPDPLTGERYFGRGYVQLTWASNYKELGKDLNIDLYHNPDLALDPVTAYRIASFGMRTGAFTGVRLSKYIDGEHCDYFNARRIINSIDQAAKIEDYAEKFETILKQCEATNGEIV